MNLEFMTDKNPLGYICTHRDNTETIYLIDDLSSIREHIRLHGMLPCFSLFSSLNEAIEENIESDLSHETIHNILNKIEGFKTSQCFDKIDDSDFEVKGEET